ncbi:protein PIF [Patella vulgata]|uniref:protein PIF n=1 Tax=Patella vulgata TaxID=6465 RepID=UPI0021807045|nr:protein PIF [Patella vulgata]
MKLHLSLTVAILASLIQYSKQQCIADMVFMIDSSINTVDNVYNALDSFITRQPISSSEIRVGAVFFSDQVIGSIPISDNVDNLRRQLSNNRIPLGSRLRYSVGIRAANTLFNIENRFVPRVAVLVTSSQAEYESNLFDIVSQLKSSNIGGRSMTVYSLGVARNNLQNYNLNELNIIATGNAIQVSSSVNVRAEFERIASTVCSNNVVTTAPVCSDFDLQNGVGYKANPKDCKRFIQCEKEAFSTNIIYNDMACNDGLFWNQELKNCVHFPGSDCYRGECDGTTYLYGSVKCGAYFNCTNGVVNSGCCPESAPEFDSVTKKCIVSSNCIFQCTLNNKISYAACQETFKIYRMPNDVIDPCRYEVHEGEGLTKSVKVMHCAAGTNFNPSKCDCSIRNKDPCTGSTPVNPCSEDFYLNFTDDRILDNSVSKAWIRNEGPVSVSGERATFDGTTRLAVLRYSNIDFVLPLAIKVKFRETSSQSNMAVLYTPSVYITAGNGRVTIGVETVIGGYNSSAATVGTNQWKEVVLYYDGTTLSGVVRSLDFNGFNIISSTPIPTKTVSFDDTVKKIQTADGALQIGSLIGGNYPAFVGDIDEVKLWKGCQVVRRPEDF